MPLYLPRRLDLSQQDLLKILCQQEGVFYTLIIYSAYVPPKDIVAHCDCGLKLQGSPPRCQLSLSKQAAGWALLGPPEPVRLMLTSLFQNLMLVRRPVLIHPWQLQFLNYKIESFFTASGGSNCPFLEAFNVFSVPVPISLFNDWKIYPSCQQALDFRFSWLGSESPPDQMAVLCGPYVDHGCGDSGGQL